MSTKSTQNLEGTLLYKYTILISLLLKIDPSNSKFFKSVLASITVIGANAALKAELSTTNNKVY